MVLAPPMFDAGKDGVQCLRSTQLSVFEKRADLGDYSNIGEVPEKNWCYTSLRVDLGRGRTASRVTEVPNGHVLHT